MVDVDRQGEAVRGLVAKEVLSWRARLMSQQSRLRRLEGFSQSNSAACIENADCALNLERFHQAVLSLAKKSDCLIAKKSMIQK